MNRPERYVFGYVPDTSAASRPRPFTTLRPGFALFRNGRSWWALKD